MVMSDTRTVRPGLLVALSTSIRGNRRYETQEIEGPHKDDQGELVSRWETTRIVEDPEEYTRAIDVRSKARGVIVNNCAATAFGLLCPLDREQKLRDGVAEAQLIAARFNATASISSVEVRVIIGRVEQDDVAAVRAITSEVSNLLQDVELGIAKMDPTAIGKACDKARDIGTMLEPEAKERLQGAIDAARVVKRQMVKLEKAGELAKIVVDQQLLDTVASARTSFLDLDECADIAAPDTDAVEIEFSSATFGAPEQDAPSIEL
jgi:hypothetical protein